MGINGGKTFKFKAGESGRCTTGILRMSGATIETVGVRRGNDEAVLGDNMRYMGQKSSLSNKLWLRVFGPVRKRN